MRLLPAPLSFRRFQIRGFTLVELLVVIAVIAILAVIAIVFFGNIPTKARDAKRRANVDAIAKAYELKYDESTGLYTDITAGDFSKAGGETLSDVRITKTLLDGNTKFRVCADLETVAGTQDYCVGSSLGGVASALLPSPTATPGPTPTPSPSPSPSPSPVACAVFNSLVAGQSQSCDVGSGQSASTMYVKCSDLQTAGSGGNYDCSKFCTWLPNGLGTSVPWYTATGLSGGTAGFMSSPCSTTPVTVILSQLP